MIPVPCPLCGADDARVLHRDASRADSPREDVRITTDVYGVFGQVVECRKCAMAYRSPRPEAKDMLEAYAALEDGDYLLEEECRSMNAFLSLRRIKAHKTGGRLLEVGCSTGYFLNAARLSFDVEGVEPSRWAAERARARLGVTVTEGALEGFDRPAGHFDVVAMLDVLEHFTDPAAELARAARLLAPGGLLYLVTPDIRSFSARLLGRYWWGLRPAHLTYFSSATLSAMLEKQGFQLLETRSYGRIFTYGYWLSRLKNYPRLFSWPIGAAIRALGWEDKPLYIDTRDSLEVCARRV